MHVTIVGTGYVGLVTGACLADAGNAVFCLDLDQEKIARLNGGEIPIFEPGLEPIVKKNRQAGRLRFSPAGGESVAHAQLPIIPVGSQDERAIALLRQIYSPFQRNHERIMVMGVRSAELTKYAANAMLATRISFMNEVANLAEALGADIEEVRRGIGADPRIGYHFLYPGVGYGGSCFPKDVKALQRSAAQAGPPPRLLRAGGHADEGP